MRSIMAAALGILLSLNCAAQQEDVIGHIQQTYLQMAQNMGKFTKKEKNDTTYTCEIGKIIAFHQGTTLELISSEALGDKERRRTEFYFENGKLMFAIDVHFYYNRPMYWDEKLAKKHHDKEWHDYKKTKKIIDRCYFSNDKLLQWISEGKEDSPFDSKKQTWKEKELLSESASLSKMFE